MPNLNRVTLMGNLCRDPELRVLPKGTPICQFALAINRTWKNDAGEKQEEVIFVDCEAWGKTGEAIAKYTSKGRPLYVEGRLKLDTWEDKNTKEKRSRMKVVVEQFQFLGSRDDAGQTPREPGPQDASAARTRAPASAARATGNDNRDESVPF